MSVTCSSGTSSRCSRVPRYGNSLGVTVQCAVRWSTRWPVLRQVFAGRRCRRRRPRARASAAQLLLGAGVAEVVQGHGQPRSYVWKANPSRSTSLDRLANASSQPGRHGCVSPAHGVVHPGQVDPVHRGQRLAVDLRTADDEDLVPPRSSLSRAASARASSTESCIVDIRRRARPVGAAGSRPRSCGRAGRGPSRATMDSWVMPAGHHDVARRSARRNRFRSSGRCHGSCAVAADDVVLVGGDDQRDGPHGATGMPQAGVRVVVGELEVLGPEVVDVGDRPTGARSACTVGRRRGSRLEHDLDLVDLVGVDVRVGDGVVVRRGLEPGELLQHQGQRGVLHHVRRHADRDVAGALEHVQVQPSIEDSHVHPAVARRDRRPRRLARARGPGTAGSTARRSGCGRPAARGSAPPGAGTGRTPGPSLVGKSWNAPPYEPGPMSPGGRPRLAVFSGVAQASHQSQPNARSSSSVVAPLMNAHSSPIGLRQKPAMLRSVMTGKPLARSNRMVCCISVSAGGPCRVGTFSPCVEDARQQVPVLRVRPAPVERLIAHRSTSRSQPRP